MTNATNYTDPDYDPDFVILNNWISKAPNGLLLRDDPLTLLEVFGPFAVIARCRVCGEFNFFVVNDQNKTICLPSTVPGDVIGVFEYIEADKISTRCVND